MARLVTRMAVRTVLGKITTNKQNKFWISGAKFDKWSTGDDQEIMVKFAKPQEVTIEATQSRWGGDNSADRLLIKDFKTENGELKEMKGWELNSYGIKFFKDKEHAEKYFLEKTHKLFSIMNPVLDLYRELHRDVEYKDPSFLVELER